MWKEKKLYILILYFFLIFIYFTYFFVRWYESYLFYVSRVFISFTVCKKHP